MVKRKPPVGDKVFQAGIKEGRRETISTVLTYLQLRYMDRQVVRGSSLGKAILEVAADLSRYIKENYNQETGEKLQKPVVARDLDSLNE